jgi:glycosyltransferase involved in cell wall biosynthesis
VRVLHNGFTLEEFRTPREQLRTEFRAQFDLGDGPVVGCVGRIKLVRKGQEVLIQAAGLLRQRGSQAKYLIVGSPFAGNEGHLAKLQEMVRDLGLEGQVVFTGEIPDPRPAYAAMDVFVLPSAQPEPFGGVVMEAMAMGPSDPSALADRIERLLGDESLRSRLGRAGPERIAKQFALDDMVRKLEQLYAELAEAHAS